MSVKVIVRDARMWVQTIFQYLPVHPMTSRKVIIPGKQIPIIIILRLIRLYCFLSLE